MPPELLKQLPSLGMAGLLFVMWWFERKERAQNTVGLHEAVKQLVSDMNDRLLAVVKANTQAMTELREELRTHRATENDWMGRVNRQLEQLELLRSHATERT